MIVLSEIIQNIEKWIESNHNNFIKNNIAVKFKFLSLEDGNFKANISFEHHSKLALLEIWSSGECDFIYENFFHTKSEANYLLFDSCESLLTIINCCYEKFYKEQPA